MLWLAVPSRVQLCTPSNAGAFVSVKLGATFTALTLTVKVLVVRSIPPLAVPPSSCATTVTMELPVVLARAVKVSRPSNVTAGCTRKRAGLLFVVKTFVMVWSDSTGLNVMKPLTDCAPASSNAMSVFDASVMIGAAFTDRMVSVKLVVAAFVPPAAVPPSSSARTVTTAEPLTFVAAMKVSEPLVRIRGWTENNAGFEFVTTTFVMLCPGSGVVMLTNDVMVRAPVFSSTVTALLASEMTGAVLRTNTLAKARSLLVFRSGTALETPALNVSRPLVSGFSVSVNVAVAPGASVPTVHKPFVSAVPCDATNETMSTSPGS